MTEISQLGEFGLIDRLTDKLPRTNNTTKYAVGDDAAILAYGDRDSGKIKPYSALIFTVELGEIVKK